MKNLSLFLLLAISLMATEGLGQRSQNNNLARFTIIVPKEGMQKEFEDGYKRHLRWHVEKGDKWNWYGWFVVSGGRLGYFVDATFGHDWSDFDKPVDPAGDFADNALNVRPFGRFHSQFTCVYLPEISRASEADLTATIPQTIYFKVKPGHESAFESDLRTIQKAMKKSETQLAHMWFRIEDGGELPQYLLFLADKSFAEKRRLTKLWRAIRHAVRNNVIEITSETLRYRADMTFIPNMTFITKK